MSMGSQQQTFSGLRHLSVPLLYAWRMPGVHTDSTPYDLLEDKTGTKGRTLATAMVPQQEDRHYVPYTLAINACYCDARPAPARHTLHSPHTSAPERSLRGA